MSSGLLRRFRNGSLSFHRMSALSQSDELLAVFESSYDEMSNRKRRALVSALGSAKDDRASRALASALVSDPDAEVRLLAAHGLGKIGDELAVSALYEALNDEARMVRTASVKALAAQKDSRHSERLLPMLADKEASTRGAAATALGEMRCAAAVGPLLSLIDDPVSNVSVRAIEALGKIGDERAIAGLEDLRGRTGRATGSFIDTAIRTIRSSDTGL